MCISRLPLAHGGCGKSVVGTRKLYSTPQQQLGVGASSSYHVQEEKTKDWACTNTSALHTACIGSTLLCLRRTTWISLPSPLHLFLPSSMDIECLAAATGKVIRRSTVVWVDSMVLPSRSLVHVGSGGVGPSDGVSGWDAMYGIGIGVAVLLSHAHKSRGTTGR